MPKVFYTMELSQLCMEKQRLNSAGCYTMESSSLINNTSERYSLKAESQHTNNVEFPCHGVIVKSRFQRNIPVSLDTMFSAVIQSYN